MRRPGSGHHNGAARGAVHQVLTRCPVCAGEMRVTRLQCDACGSALEGSFTFGRFQRLTREQLQFVELFILCRGKIKDVEERLGVSYPTVVARLNEVVRAMGYDVAQEDTEAIARRQEVLDAVAAGTITPAEAAERLRALSV